MGAYLRIAKLPVFIALLLVFSIAVACGGSAPAEPEEKPMEKKMAKEAEKPVASSTEAMKEQVKEAEKPAMEKESMKEESKEAPMASPLAAYFDDFPQAGVDGVPESVGKMTMVWQSWGTSEVNPWTLSSVAYLNDQFNLTLFRQHPNGELAPMWGTEWSQDEQGVTVKLDPNAKFQDGTPADAEALRKNLLGITNQLPEAKAAGYDKPVWNSGRVKEHIEDIEVISPTEIYFKTPGADPIWMWVIGGNGYHVVWFSNPTQMLKGSDAFLNNLGDVGAGPLRITDWDPGNRLVLERWDDFWADYPWYHKPQYSELENLLVADHAARFALLKSKQADVVYYVTWPLAKDLDRSEDAQRGVNPGNGDLWTQQYKANGMLVLDFYLPMILRQSQKQPGMDAWGAEVAPWEYPSEYVDHPTLDVRVREALSMAIDRKELSRGPHFGLSFPIGSIFHHQSIGSREDVVLTPPPFDPEKAKALMVEAGYADGFEMPGHFGQFAGRPGIIETVDFIASAWEKYLGVKVVWKEFDPSEFVKGFGRAPEPQPLVRVPVDVKTWGRQDHSLRELLYYRSNSVYIGPADDGIEQTIYDATETFDPVKLEPKMHKAEDDILALKETFPLYGMNLVWGYTDRVLAHPTVEASPHPKHVELIVLRD